MGASSRLSCPCWRDRHRDPGHPALPCGGRGRMTEQGMAQGQPGRPPPGHAWRAPRHFVRDAVVFEDYTIAEGRVIPQGAPGRAIILRPAPHCRSSWPPGAWGYARRLGLCPDLWLVGLCATGGCRRPWRAQRRGGDPLGWIWAQAETVALCLHLTYGLQAGDDAALLHSTAVQLPQPPQADGGPQLIVPRSGISRGFPSAGRRRCTAPRTGGCMPAPCAVK